MSLFSIRQSPLFVSVLLFAIIPLSEAGAFETCESFFAASVLADNTRNSVALTAVVDVARDEISSSENKMASRAPLLTESNNGRALLQTLARMVYRFNATPSKLISDYREVYQLKSPDNIGNGEDLPLDFHLKLVEIANVTQSSVEKVYSDFLELAENLHRNKGWSATADLLQISSLYGISPRELIEKLNSLEAELNIRSIPFEIELAALESMVAGNISPAEAARGLMSLTNSQWIADSKLSNHVKASILKAVLLDKQSIAQLRLAIAAFKNLYNNKYGSLYNYAAVPTAIENSAFDLLILAGRSQDEILALYQQAYRTLLKRGRASGHWLDKSIGLIFGRLLVAAAGDFTGNYATAVLSAANYIRVSDFEIPFPFGR